MTRRVPPCSSKAPLKAKVFSVSHRPVSGPVKVACQKFFAFQLEICQKCLPMHFGRRMSILRFPAEAKQANDSCGLFTPKLAAMCLSHPMRVLLLCMERSIRRRVGKTLRNGHTERDLRCQLASRCVAPSHFNVYIYVATPVPNRISIPERKRMQRDFASRSVWPFTFAGIPKQDNEFLQ